MHFDYWFYALGLEGFDYFIGIRIIILENGILRSLLRQKFGNTILTKPQQPKHPTLQLQILNSGNPAFLFDQIHANIQKPRVNNKSIQKIDLTHQHIQQIRHKIFLVMLVLHHQQPDLNIQAVLRQSCLCFEVFWVLGQ